MVRRGAWAALSFAILCAAGAAAFFLLRSRPPHREDLSTLLSPVDAAIAAGSLDTARGALENMRVLPSTDESLLRVLNAPCSSAAPQVTFACWQISERGRLPAVGEAPRCARWPPMRFCEQGVSRKPKRRHPAGGCLPESVIS